MRYSRLRFTLAVSALVVAAPTRGFAADLDPWSADGLAELGSVLRRVGLAVMGDAAVPGPPSPEADARLASGLAEALHNLRFCDEVFGPGTGRPDADEAWRCRGRAGLLFLREQGWSVTSSPEAVDSAAVFLLLVEVLDPAGGLGPTPLPDPLSPEPILPNCNLPAICGNPSNQFEQCYCDHLCRVDFCHAIANFIDVQRCIQNSECFLNQCLDPDYDITSCLAAPTPSVPDHDPGGTPEP